MIDNRALPRLIILISGSGTNLQAILDAVAQQRLKANIVLVVSNRKAAYGLIRAEQANIPTLYFPLKPYTDAGQSREVYDADLADRLQVYAPDLIVLAGWMHVFTPTFLQQFPSQVINLHPALPGQFPGVEAIQRAYEVYQRGEISHSGCMVHYVVPEVDAGAVIAQTDVLIHPDDTLEAFESRMHATEHQLIVQAIALALAQKIND